MDNLLDDPMLATYSHGLDLRVVRGRQDLLATITGERLGEWSSLAADQRKVTVFQTPGFVLSWYEAYESLYEPLVLLGLDSEERLAGIMLLAIDRGEGQIVFAGAEQAEYAGWLAVPAFDDVFPPLCVAHLRRLRLFHRRWTWKWIAPGTSIRWLQHPVLSACGITTRATSFSNPVIRLDDKGGRGFFASHKSHSHKWRVNRLKSLGELRLVRLLPSTLTDVLFDQFKSFYDMRQLSRFGTAPFLEDSRKGTFHRRLLENAPDSVMCLALMAGDQPVAFHFDLLDRQRAILCLNPFDQRWIAFSPARVMGDLVADELAAQGIDSFDLTPGGDKYKEDLASAHETVHSIRIFPSLIGAAMHDTRERVRSLAKRIALRLGVTRERVEPVSRVVQGLRMRSLPVAFRFVGRQIWSRHRSWLYRVDRGDWSRTSPSSPSEPPCVRRDRLEDFLLYQASARGPARKAVMSDAIRRISKGEHCYTVVEDDRLLHWRWLQPNARSIGLEVVGNGLPLPPGTTVVSDSYTEPCAAARRLDEHTLHHVTREALGEAPDAVLVMVPGSHTALRRAVEAMGFTSIGALTRFRFFGKTWYRGIGDLAWPGCAKV